ncbi:Pr6Pr family membrane protein [Curtobacterium ammoniigenes]|uniref:Pr6Pr family membrane protein n=1 Tax=Curtobacterium ammoniigenes TaxID=395387 RepID=UPI0014703BA9|nr:Pr6Pr family membrane protein [Curtobacterium ammoniigenes]
MRSLVLSLRLLAVVAVVAAIVAQFVRSLEAPNFVFWNFFGYFTIQSNIIVAVAFAVTIVSAARRGRRAERWTVLRGAATVYIATTGLVYNTLLVHATLDNSFTVPWSNDILHKWIPVYAVLDWILFSDRARMVARQVWLILIYPAVWLVVILIRGATDGWVPYPFLNPKLGYGFVALYCLGIALFIAVMGLFVIALSRVRLVRIGRA